MTLIVALQGKDELVFASDTLVWEGVKDGYYTSQASKLRVIGQNWISGSAGTGIGADLQAQIAAGHEEFEPDVDEGAAAYATRCSSLLERQTAPG